MPLYVTETLLNQELNNVNEKNNYFTLLVVDLLLPRKDYEAFGYDTPEHGKDIWLYNYAIM